MVHRQRAPEESRIIRTARQVNDDKPELVLAKVAEHAARFQEPVIAALGLAFKPDIDDLRESPALAITEQIARRHPEATVLAVEPTSGRSPGPPSRAERASGDHVEALTAADVVVLLVDHREFKHVDRTLVRDKAVIDTRGVWRDRG